MEAILLDVPVPSLPGWLAELADDMVEDPRCHAVVLGSDEQGSVLFTMWDDEAVDEVERGLLQLGQEARVRRLSVAEGQAVWA